MLYHPFFKVGFSAPEMLGWFFGRQELAHLRREAKRLELEVKTLRADAWAAMPGRRTGCAGWSAVHFAPVVDLGHGDGDGVVFDVSNDAVVADAVTP